MNGPTINHPDPGFGGICPRPEGGTFCGICELCLDHCQCKRERVTSINAFRQKKPDLVFGVPVR